MGQSITVVQKPTTTPGVLRFETNRSLTGMGHERYRRGEEVVGQRPPDELARRLFDRGGVEAIHVYSNIITVDLAEGGLAEGGLAEGGEGAAMLEVIHDLFIHYRPGVRPPTDEELTGAAPAAD